MAKVVLLNSGGLDSAMVGKWAADVAGHEVHSFHIETDCINAAQQLAAAAQTGTNYAVDHFVYPFKFGTVPNYWEWKTTREQMTEADTAFYPTDPPVRFWASVPDPAATYAARPWNEFRTFPNLSMTFYSMGVTYAKFIGATEVYSGARLTQDDQYVTMFNQMAEMSRLQVARPQLVAPFSESISYEEAAEILVGHTGLTEAEVAALQAEFAYTYSCRWPTPCGICEKCTGRAAIGLV